MAALTNIYNEEVVAVGKEARASNNNAKQAFSRMRLVGFIKMMVLRMVVFETLFWLTGLVGQMHRYDLRGLRLCSHVCGKKTLQRGQSVFLAPYDTRREQKKMSTRLDIRKPPWMGT
jgi:hypothetical protein